jgi:DNA ligase (NAD+)
MSRQRQYATKINNKGKTEKNKKVKEGECLFPFKYKWKEHNSCFPTDFGDICATEVNQKSRTLVKYGYCQPTPPKKSKKSSKKNSTVKKALSTSFKKTKKIKLNIVDLKSSLKTKTPVSSSMDKKTSTRLNEKFIKVMDELTTIMTRQGEGFRAKAYRQAGEAITNYKGDITDPEQLKGVKYIGKTIMEKLKEYVKTGTLQVLDRERKNPLNLLTKVYGIGPKKAKEFINKGITTVQDLRDNEGLLTKNMKIGVKYFDDIEARIPREEIVEYDKILKRIFNTSTSPGSMMEIVGSYRRGAKTSGDIDIIITNDENNNKILDLFLDKLVKDKIIIEILSKGKIKSMTIGQIPGHRPRRLDFMYAPPKEYAFATLYFTGSKAFNTVQRQRALDMGYTLNEHGFHHMVTGEKGKKVEGDFPNEESIFNFLGMKYIPPDKRIDGRSIVLITPDKAKTPSPIKKPTPPIGDNITIKIKVPKKTTLKRKKTIKKDIILQFKKEGLSALKTMSERELSKIIRDANDAYYCDKIPILTDNEYDILREYTMERFPKNKAVTEGHTKCKMEVVKNKVKLPYEMWSMDKIKPDTGALSKWKKKYSGPYVLSCKLDGVSGMYSTEGADPALYTRGNGKVGQDISHLIPLLRLPKEKGIVLRGEFIIQKKIFMEKYAAKFANPRNFVAGLINQKKLDPADFENLDFVAYEVIKPEMLPGEQMKYLISQDVEVVRNVVEKDVTNELLSELLVAWRDDYKYEIDGVICIDNKIYPRETGNPDHAFAFKMVLSDQIAEAKVLDVIWTPSKDGYLKPRVQIDPVVLGGAKIEYATGFNGKFIEDNTIGVGSLIKLIRSGDVIPHIIAVIQPASQPLMPSVPYIWNDTHVDIMLKDKSQDSTVKEKTIAGFFKVLDVGGLGPGNVKRLIKAGFDTVPKIIGMSKEDFLTVDGVKELTSEKLYIGIKDKVEKASLPELMQASNIFGRGFGKRRFTSILAQQPDILVSPKIDAEKLESLKAIDGMAKKSAEKFLFHIVPFVEWAKSAGLESRLVYKAKPNSADTGHDLFGKKWVMTGFRDKELIEKLGKVGAQQQSAVSKKTFMVIVKDKDEDTGKAEEAKRLGVQVLTPEEVIEKYKL